MSKQTSKKDERTQASTLDLIRGDGRIKAVRCACGAAYVHQCRMPMAEMEPESIKDFASYARKGRRIEMLLATDCPPFCTCESTGKPAKILKPKTKKKKPPFEYPVDPRQLRFDFYV
jgi:hypothetical protein